jgi:membrane-associated phospholipid phosphatase
MLWNRWIYLVVFVAGFFLSKQFNRFLKSIIQEPRPEDPVFYSKLDDFSKATGTSKWGMPSGHAQLAFYCVAFLVMALPSTRWVIYATLIIGALTAYQIWKYRKHSFRQVVAGTVIGALLGLFAYSATRYAVKQHTITV